MGKKLKKKPSAPVLAATFYEFLLRKGLAPSSAGKYCSIAKRWEGDHGLMLAMLDAHSDPDTPSGTMSGLLTTANHWAEWMGYPRPSAQRKYRFSKDRNYKGLIVRREEAHKFLKHCPSSIGKWCALLATETGLRGNSIVALTDQHINDALASGYILVRAKGGKTVAVKLLKQGRKALKKIRKLGGTPNKEEALRHQWRKTREQYDGHRKDANRWTMHTFRHAFATTLAERGAPLPALQDLLGHTDIKTTMRYAHIVNLDKTMDLLK